MFKENLFILEYHKMSEKESRLALQTLISLDRYNFWFYTCHEKRLNAIAKE